MDLPINYDKAGTAKRRKAREQYVIDQEHKCYHCKASLDGPPRLSIRQKSLNHAVFPTFFFRHPVHLHHDHTTGMTIGAVHARCNAVLWQYHGK